MAKQACEFPRDKDGFTIPPECCILIGLDTTHAAGSHPLYDDRVFNKPTRQDIASMKLVGGRVAPPQVIFMEWATIPELKDSWKTTALAAWKRLKPDETELPLKVPVVAQGRQRTLAARAVNREAEVNNEPFRLSLPCRHFKAESDEQEFVYRILENRARTDMKPLEMATEINRNMKMYGSAEESVALTFRIPKQRVQWYLSLLELVEDVQKAIKDGKVSATRAQPWSVLSGEEQRKKLREALDPLSGAKGEEGDEDGDGDGEGSGSSEEKLPAGASTPKGHAVPRAMMARIYQLKKAGKLRLDKPYADALGWASGELKGEEVPPAIVEALRQISAIDEAAEAAKAAKQAAKAAAAAEKATAKAEKQTAKPAAKPTAETAPKQLPMPVNAALPASNEVTF